MLLLGDLKAYGIECFMCAPCQEPSEQIARIVEQLQFNGGTGAEIMTAKIGRAHV